MNRSEACQTASAWVAGGPIFERCQLNGAEVLLTFSSIGGGLVAQGGTLQGFELSADGKLFVPATAVIAGATVVVRSAVVPAPTAVRYAWAGFPDATLYNKDGLPASPFRFPVPGVPAR
jgi:sialate O-acetylesterase